MLAGSLDACLREEVNDLNNKSLIFQRFLVQSISTKKKRMWVKRHQLNHAFEFYYRSDQN